MDKIARGAESQTGLVSQASKVITEMAGSIERTAVSAEDAARAAGETSGAAEVLLEQINKVGLRLVIERRAAKEELPGAGRGGRRKDQGIGAVGIHAPES